MFRDLKPYPEGETGTQPAHWRVVPGLGVLRLVNEKNTGLREETVLSLSRGRVVVKPPEKLHGLVPASFESYQRLRPENIVIRPTDLQNDQTSVRVGFVRDRGIITSAYLGFEVRIGALPEFAYLYLATLDAQKVFYGMGSGLRQNLDWSDFKRLPIAVPPAEEQAGIVKYLGHAHARIDRAIAAKRKLIALLEEQKQAIINQAVTRGLDPTVPMKDSDIPWLGQIPAHWGTRKLGWLFRTQGSGTTPPRDDQYDGDVPWIMSGDLNNGRIAVTKKTVTRDAVSELSSLRVYAPGALVVAMYGATIGKNAVTNVAAATNQACCVFADPREGVQVEYVQLAMTAGRAALAERGVGGGQPNVNAQIVKQFRVPSPPVDEQAAIVVACAFEALRTERIAEKTLKEIVFLREFRARLTSDVVTGQLDVREVAATLPDFVEHAPVDADSGEDESFGEFDEVLEEAEG